MKQHYTFTGYLMSTNPDACYYDKFRRVVFATGKEVSAWSAAPIEHDRVVISRNNDNIIEEVFINDKKVYP